MRSIWLSLTLMFGITLLNPSPAVSGDEKSAESALNNVDALQALAIANEWKWSNRSVKSYVTTREVVFKFSDGTSKRIPLPQDKMVVAVAPYVNRTHR